MASRKNSDSKHRALADRGTLNPHPHSVRDNLFAEQDFFDPRDLVQVKYEMLRQVRAEGQSVAGASREFGLSRPTFYQALGAFERQGLRGLLPAKKGPRGAHKLSPRVLAFVRAKLAEDSSRQPRDVASEIEEEFGVSVHPRSIERALLRAEKKTP